MGNNIRKIFSILFAFFLFYNPSILAKTYYVKPGGNDDDAGTSWGVAFQTITEALNTALNTDSIWVAEGTYKEGETLNIPINVELFGGFSGNEASLEERNITKYPTIIDGMDSYRCITNYGYVDGFYIIRGKAFNYEGGGVGNILGVIDHCFIHGNCNGIYGGGIYNDGGIVKNTEVFDNKADIGGAGIFNNGGILLNCSIHENVITNGDYGGGGIANILGRIDNCEIYSNNSQLTGGGIRNIGGIVSNCILYNNFASYSGGGIQTEEYPIINEMGLIENCTVFNNSSEYGTGGIDVGSSIVNNCIIWNNTIADIYPIYGDVNYSCFGEATGINGNINLDPLFVNAQNPKSVWDFRLQKNSPCIDAGNPDAIYYDGCIPPGRKTSRNDMGAFGGPHNCNWLDDLTTGVMVDIILGRDDLSSPTIPIIDQNKDESIDIADLIMLIKPLDSP